MGKKIRILAAGDLHGSKDIAEKLAKIAKKEKVDLVVLAGDISGFGGESSEVLKPFSKEGQKVLFIPGNWDTFEDIKFFEEHGKNIHHYYVKYGDVGILGVGNPDWKMALDKDDLRAIERNIKRMKAEKKLLVSHLHIGGSKAEFSGVPGDKILRRVVDTFKPDIVISGHIHEAEGLEGKIGKTRFFQVGRNGKILEI